MRKKKRSFFELLFSFLVLGILIFLILNYSPNFQLAINNFKFPILPIFFILVFSFFYFLFDVLFANRRRGLLIGSFVSLFLLLRFFGLTHILFLILLIVLFGGIEMFFVKRG